MDVNEITNNSELVTSKKMLIITSIFLLILLVWQTISASVQHQAYQGSLMDSVTDRVLSDYQEYFSQLRLEIDLLQQKQLSNLNALEISGKNAKEDDYMAVLNVVRKDIKNTRLFALIDNHGQGSLSHITGDFLPACKEEIKSTLQHGTQKHIFLHRSKNSVHFDLLQPLLTNNQATSYLFVAFNPDILKKLLMKYQLPHQELFLMRSDNIGKIELSSQNNNKQYDQMTMSSKELNSFNYVKPISGTRWQIAIRLDPKYSSNLFLMGVLKALGIWSVLTFIIYMFYKNQQQRSRRYLKIHQQLSYKDNYDKLTGLNNRAYFENKLASLINEKHQKELSRSGVVLHLDIDQFQIINNNFGYGIGDKYLSLISDELIKFSPQDATVSRLGNDEFAILLPDLPHQDAKDYAHEVRMFFQQLEFPQLEQKIKLTVSIGIVMLDCYQQDIEQVFSSLAQAMNLAKEKGRNRVQLYQSNDTQLIQHANDMAAVHELAAALKDNRLILYRQEIRALNSMLAHQRYEILVRMKNKQNKLVPPGLFIPAAEKYGMISQLDFWVIANTFKAICELDKQGNTCYSINLSGLTLANRDLFDFVKSQFDCYKVAPQRICFEVTETSAITHLGSALHFMEEMIELGCSFSLDDFGSGLSSFSYLQTLPVKIIKIDGAFIKDINHNKINRIFVENIFRTAVAMDKQTVAEFVESAEIAQTLKDIGIDYGQGYHIHKPELWYDSNKED